MFESPIDFIEKIKFTNKDFDVMIEAKQKDDALFRLIRQLKYKTDYKIEKKTITSGKLILQNTLQIRFLKKLSWII